VDVALIRLLLSNNYIPVIICFASDQSGVGYNINADMVVVMANGMAKNEVIKNKQSKDYEVFKDNLENMMIHLAQ
jgi:acetylglutamate kinase